MTLAERYHATLLESARLLENADRLAVQNSDLRDENARLRAAIAPTRENEDALIVLLDGMGVRISYTATGEIYRAIAARAGVKL